MTHPTDVLDLVRRWARAEERNDPELLDPLLDADFRGVGPVGFVLGRDMWLGRFSHGLVNRSFAIEEAQVREYGDTAVIVAEQVQETRHKKGDTSGRFRVTLVAVRRDGRWYLAHVHIGQLGGRP